MAKKAASLKKQLADGIKLILVITSFASIAAFLSSLGFHGTDGFGGKKTTRWDWEWAEKTGDFFGTTPLTVSVFSFIAIVVSLGLAIFIHQKFSPEDKELEGLCGTPPTKEDLTVSSVFKSAGIVLLTLCVVPAAIYIWIQIKALFL